MGDGPPPRMTARQRPWVSWGFARVTGPSMVPTLRDGDVLLVRHGATVRPGDVVAARRPDRPATIVVKRVERRDGDGWWLVSDNPYAGTDSAVFGAVPDGLVIARAVLRRDARRRRPLGWGRIPPAPPDDLAANDLAM